jgi:nucleotide-binding universal stress UspA family protein
MIEIGKILLPTDFSPCADRALDHALVLAARYRASLHMLHAIVLHDHDPHSPGAQFLDVAEIHQRLQDLARIEMKTSLRSRGSKLPGVVLRQRRGLSPARVILDYANEQRPDLIVMGTHGRHGLGHLLMGSVAGEVVRGAPCPVLTFCERFRLAPSGRMRRILVPIDFSKHASHAMEHARELASAYGARIDLLHVIEETPRPAFYEVAGAGPSAADPVIEERARREMRRLYEAAPGPRVDVRYRVTRGKASDEIVRFAGGAGIDLLVIATHGLSGLRHWLLGSVAEQVVRRAPCPVFTVRAFGRPLTVQQQRQHRTAGQGVDS